MKVMELANSGYPSSSHFLEALLRKFKEAEIAISYFVLSLLVAPAIPLLLLLLFLYYCSCYS